MHVAEIEVHTYTHIYIIIYSGPSRDVQIEKWRHARMLPRSEFFVHTCMHARTHGVQMHAVVECSTCRAVLLIRTYIYYGTVHFISNIGVLNLKYIYTV